MSLNIFAICHDVLFRPMAEKVGVSSGWQWSCDVLEMWMEDGDGCTDEYGKRGAVSDFCEKS